MLYESQTGHYLTHTTDTLRYLESKGTPISNIPQQSETLIAFQEMERSLLSNIQAKFGSIEITYGFASMALVRAVRRRAKEEGRNPQIAPELDQHCGYELNQQGHRICKRDGIAIDFRVPGISSETVASWIRENLNFDRMYLYGAERPLHISWAPVPVGQVWQMVNVAGRVIPKRA